MATQIVVPCVGCGGRNRVDLERIDEGARCGRCATALLLDRAGVARSAAASRAPLPPSDLGVLFERIFAG